MLASIFGIVFLLLSLYENNLNGIILSCILILLDNKETTVIINKEK